jgi:hypothetical protein
MLVLFALCVLQLQLIMNYSIYPLCISLFNKITLLSLFSLFADIFSAPVWAHPLRLAHLVRHTILGPSGQASVPGVRWTSSLLSAPRAILVPPSRISNRNRARFPQK